MIGYTAIRGVYGGHFPVEVRRACKAGEGIVDNVGFVKVLKASGWDGYLSLEAFGKENIVHGLAWMKKT